ncbi:uncharacterized protein K452DRAFT_287218 [Aplosporella prunicola CBS 121167]|uniref:Uncharacterized protein n=1 Tax=Aplosporella prunicola CBS 121167 TaxID=1176127 RepID=A0A6A6BCU7_9PEZI|nr:uncharacterized protein K452DRAFT_287218 [Aplosporella prunicola CBS 121167]KAF2142022.1 hypothetical protein K452DRAFT_287218 [Aplosporella prunicola CBS 121167]
MPKHASPREQRGAHSATVSARRRIRKRFRYGRRGLTGVVSSLLGYCTLVQGSLRLYTTKGCFNGAVSNLAESHLSVGLHV